MTERRGWAYVLREARGASRSRVRGSGKRRVGGLRGRAEGGRRATGGSEGRSGGRVRRDLERSRRKFGVGKSDVWEGETTLMKISNCVFSRVVCVIIERDANFQALVQTYVDEVVALVAGYDGEQAITDRRINLKRNCPFGARKSPSTVPRPAPFEHSPDAPLRCSPAAVAEHPSSTYAPDAPLPAQGGVSAAPPHQRRARCGASESSAACSCGQRPHSSSPLTRHNKSTPRPRHKDD